MRTNAHQGGLHTEIAWELCENQRELIQGYGVEGVCISDKFPSDAEAAGQ